MDKETNFSVPDNVRAKLVNELRDVAVSHHNHQSLREKISKVVSSYITKVHPVGEPDGWHFKFYSGAENFVTNIDAADLIKLNLQKKAKLVPSIYSAPDDVVLGLKIALVNLLIAVQSCHCENSGLAQDQASEALDKAKEYGL